MRVGPGEGLGGWVEVGVERVKGGDSRRHDHEVATGSKIRTRASSAIYPRTAPEPAAPALRRAPRSAAAGGSPPAPSF